MKKKTLLLAAVAVLSISAAACSKKEEPAPTSAATEASTEAASEAATETSTEAVSEEYMSGILTGIDGDTLTIKSDEDDSERTYSIKDAELIHEFPLAEGDWVDVSFPEGSTKEPVPVITLEVTMSMIEQNSDPVAEGTVTDAAKNTMTLDVDGEEYTLNTSNAYVVGKNGIQTDKQCKVSYLGFLDDDPIVTKIVMEDSYDTPEAEINAFIGTVAQIGQDGRSIVLETEAGDFFTFVNADIDFSAYKESQTVQITYDGSIGDKEIAATAITKK